MKRNTDYKKSLNLFKNITFVLLIVAAGMIAFSDYRILGVILVFISLFLEWKFYRCPHCKKAFDPRINLNQYDHCPYCGEKI